MTIPKPTTMVYYDLFEILKFMEDKGYMSSDKFWDEHITEDYTDIRNDSYTFLNFYYYGVKEPIDEKKKEFHKYYRDLARELGLNIEKVEGINVRISW
jgi:hypothetical protein